MAELFALDGNVYVRALRDRGAAALASAMWTPESVGSTCHRSGGRRARSYAGGALGATAP